jgi:hypothetical protein
VRPANGILCSTSNTGAADALDYLEASREKEKKYPMLKLPAALLLLSASLTATPAFAARSPIGVSDPTMAIVLTIVLSIAATVVIRLLLRRH